MAPPGLAPVDRGNATFSKVDGAVVPPRMCRWTGALFCRSYGEELTAQGRREIAILMSFPPPLRSGFIVADRKPVAPAFAIGSYATACASSFLMRHLLT